VGSPERPTLPSAVRRLFRFPTSRDSLTRETDDEIAFHLEAKTERLIEEGLDPEAARREAVRRFGDPRRVRDECRSVDGRRARRERGAAWWHDLVQDARLAVRGLRRGGAVTALALVTLALGIGVTSAFFSLVHAVLLKPLPYPEPDRLVLVWEGSTGDRGSVSAGNFADWAATSVSEDGARSFEALAALQGGSFNLAGDELPEQVSGTYATAGLFPVLGVPPLHGQVFTEAHDRPGAPPVVVLSEGLWRRRFGADPGVVGSSLRLDGVPHQVLGVMPERFDPLADGTELWKPMGFSNERLAFYDEHTYLVLGRLAAGVDAAAARRELRTRSADRQAQAPDEQRDLEALVSPLTHELVENHRTRLLVLLVAAALVLLIACANVANLLLARGAARGREMAVRTALGGGRGRLVRQLLTESLVLSLAAAVGGVALAALLVRVLVALAPAGVPRLEEARVDWVVVAFALGLALLTSLLAGLAPALRGARSGRLDALYEGGRGSGGVVKDRLRGALVGAEVALALVLLLSAGLLLRSGIELGRVDSGFATDHLLTLRVTLPAVAYGEPERAEAAFEDLEARLRALPGVTRAAVVNRPPMTGAGSSNGLRVEGRPMDPEGPPLGHLRVISPEYLETLGVPVVSGRGFTATDRAGAPRVMLLNRTLARRLFPDGDAVGRRIGCCEGSPEDPRWKTVVGVVGDVKSAELGTDSPAMFYLPLAQTPDDAWDWFQRTLSLVIRTEVAPETLTDPVRRAVAGMDAELPVFDVATVEERMARSLAETRFNTLLLTLMGAAGLLLAAVGIFATLAYLVEQRQQEIGIRMALGARPGEVAALVVRQALPAVAAGLALGCAGALAAGRVLDSFLFGVEPADPATFGGVILVLGLAALAAAAIPARRAASVDPARTL
jgi:putative ABC transport system permease protein